MVTTLLTAALLAGAPAKPSKNAPPSLEIAPCSSFGGITSKTTRKDLDALFGAANVKDEQRTDGEGETVTTTLLFPKDPARRAMVIWKEPAPNAGIAEVRVDEPAHAWKTTNGLAVGMSLEEVEKLNGAPFTFAGVGWDLGGRSISWGKGHFAEAFHVTFDIQLEHASAKQSKKVTGDVELHSDDPAVRALHPKVATLACTGP